MNSTVSPIAGKVNNVFIHVRDLKRSVAWYSHLLGLPFDERDVESPVYPIPVTSKAGLTLDDHTFDPALASSRLTMCYLTFMPRISTRLPVHS